LSASVAANAAVATSAKISAAMYFMTRRARRPVPFSGARGN
jgi:hypothetical protein